MYCSCCSRCKTIVQSDVFPLVWSAIVSLAARISLPFCFLLVSFVCSSPSSAMFLTRSEYDRGVNTFSPEGRSVRTDSDRGRTAGAAGGAERTATAEDLLSAAAMANGGHCSGECANGAMHWFCQRAAVVDAAAAAARPASVCPQRFDSDPTPIDRSARSPAALPTSCAARCPIDSLFQVEYAIEAIKVSCEQRCALDADARAGCSG